MSKTIRDTLIRLLAKRGDSTAMIITMVEKPYLSSKEYASIKKDIYQAEADIQALIDEVIGEDEKHERVREPTHGSCCTCQICGKYYDECDDINIWIRNKLRAEQRKRKDTL